MSKLITLSIDVTAIPKEKITPHKNGKKYLAIDIWINDEPNEWGNDVSANISQTKEEREAKAKKVYIGNGQTKFGFDDSIKVGSKPSPKPVVTDDDDESDSIPF
jgi:hypothetical protein